MEDSEIVDQSEEAKGRVAEEETKQNDEIKVKVRHQIYMQQGSFIEFAVKTNN
jgi:hypothetical protein